MWSKLSAARHNSVTVMVYSARQRFAVAGALHARRAREFLTEPVLPSDGRGGAGARFGAPRRSAPA